MFGGFVRSSSAKLIAVSPLSPARSGWVLALLLVAAPASADRIAVIALQSPTGLSPVVQADRVAAELTSKGHRVIGSADAAGRLSSGDAGAGPDWAARQLQTIQLARSALTRLDRHFASSAEIGIAREIVARGGGAGGSELLVEWCLLDRQLASTGGDVRAARLWLDRAVAMGPSFELDPVRHPTDEVDQFSRRKSALVDEVPSALSVTTVPAAADVWVDGVRRCASPCSVKLVPGRHLALVSSPAHRPATLDVELPPGAETRRQLALSAAYAGASPRAVASMFADPSRRGEAAAALEPMARFLDVEHVVALIPEQEGQNIRILVSPPAAGRSRIGPAAAERDVDNAVLEQLRPTEPERTAGSGLGGAGTESKPWYAKPGVWIGGGIGLAAAIVGGVLIYDASRKPTGTLIIQ
jgi:hypothetical protein